jgi:hypothetical protein
VFESRLEGIVLASGGGTRSCISQSFLLAWRWILGTIGASLYGSKSMLKYWGTQSSKICVRKITTILVPIYGTIFSIVCSVLRIKYMSV